MTKISIRASLLAAVVAALATGVLAGPASASKSCSGVGDVKADPFSKKMYPTVYCFVYRSTDLYSEPLPDANVMHSGKMYRGKSWFVCQVRGGENPPIGNARNNVWVYTRADKVILNDGWGWVPATTISSGGNYLGIPWVRWCDPRG